MAGIFSNTVALVVLVIAGGLQYLNIKTVKRPYISPAAWRYPNLWKILLLFGVIYILQAAPGCCRILIWQAFFILTNRI